jgi:hypothetical protein
MNEVPRGWGAYSLFENCELRQYKYKLYGIGWVPFISPLYQILMVDFVILLRSEGGVCICSRGRGTQAYRGGVTRLAPWHCQTLVAPRLPPLLARACR